MNKWDKFYIDFCCLVSELSSAKRLKVGAVIVRDNNIISYGYNGTCSGSDNNCETELEFQETWKETEFKNHFVSNTGFVKRIDRKNNVLKETILNARVNKKGYSVVKINGIYEKVHYIVAKAFIENPEPAFYNQINHIDFVKQNNHVLNLEWCTNRYNCEHRSLFLHQRDLPIGIYLNENRKKKYCVRVYKNRNLISQRFELLQDAIDFRESVIDKKDYITFRYSNLHTKREVIHAEINAVSKAAKLGISTANSVLYCNICPCIECAKLIIQSGIVKVIYKEDYRDTSGFELLLQSNIQVIKWQG